jgi:hypothetical protein
VVRGYSIENAVAEFTRAPVQEVRPEASPPAATAIADPENNVQRLQNQQLAEQVRTLRSYVDELRAELVAKEAALRNAGEKLDRLKDKTAREIKRQHEIKIRDKEIERLRAILRSERKYTKKLKKNIAARKKAEQIEEVKGLRRLKPLQALSREAVLLAIERYALDKGDLVFLEDASGGGKSTAELIKETGIAAVVKDSEMAPALQEHFLDLGVPVFSCKDLPVQRIDGLPFVRPEDVEAAQMRWAEQMKARQARLQAEKLESLFQDYKVERMKEEKRKQKMGLADKI